MSENKSEISSEEYRSRIITVMKKVDNFSFTEGLPTSIVIEAKELHNKINESLIVKPINLDLEMMIRIERDWEMKLQNIKNKVD